MCSLTTIHCGATEYRKRTNKELLEEEEYLQKVTAIAQVGAIVGLGRQPAFGVSPPAPPTITLSAPAQTIKASPKPPPLAADRTQKRGMRMDNGFPEVLHVDLDDIRHLEMRYSRARPNKIELAVEYVGGRIRVYEVDRFLIERLLEQLQYWDA